MKFKKFVLVVIVGLAILLIAVGVRKSRSDKAELVERGKYLVELGGCNLCHTPKIMTPSGMELDESRMLSGHPEDAVDSSYTAEALNNEGTITQSNFHLTKWTGPWGTSFAANLTPDEETGIGSWTEDIFIETIRSGRHMGSGRRILLPMPVQVFAQFTDDDLKAIFTYLKSIPAVKNRVPSPIPAAEETEEPAEK